MKPRIIFLVGPTATGKSRVAAALARKIKAEIISCDSMQIYKGMELLTSKPPAALTRAVPHHLLGAITATREYDVSRYYREAAARVSEITGRGKVPLIVGGTGLYMSVLLDGIFPGRGPEPEIRSHLYEQAQKKGSGFLYKRLCSIDPRAAFRIHPNDTRRIVRALEVFETTGRPISELQRQRKGLSYAYRVKVFGLDIPRQELYRRIEQRTENMFKRGLVSEVKGLLKLKLSRTARYAIGIREIQGYLRRLYSLEEAKRLIQKNTRNYAKRQLTWFRKDKRICWLKIKDKDTPASIAQRIYKKIK